MNSTLLAVRAVTSEYAAQLLWPLLWIVLGVYGVVLLLVIWIAVAFSPWWLLLALLPTVLFAACMALWIGSWILTKRLAPLTNSEQRKATKKFVKHLDQTAVHLGTPRFVLIYRMVKDAIVRPNSRKTFIGELAQTPGDMMQDFVRLRSLF